MVLATILLAQAEKTGFSFWDVLTPGAATTAVIVVVVIFLKQQRYMQNRYDQSLARFGQKLDEISKETRKEFTDLIDRMERNEERRMQQIQVLFERYMTQSNQMVEVLTEMRLSHQALTKRVEDGLSDKRS